MVRCWCHPAGLTSTGHLGAPGTPPPNAIRRDTTIRSNMLRGTMCLSDLVVVVVVVVVVVGVGVGVGVGVVVVVVIVVGVVVVVVAVVVSNRILVP